MDENVSLDHMNASNIQGNYVVTGTTSLPFIIVVYTTAVLGVIGNSVTLLVLLKERKWTSVNVLIFLMSISDTLALPIVLFLPTQIFFRIQPFVPIVYLRDITMFSSALCAMIIGCERVFTVWKPLSFKQIWSTKFTIVVYFIAMLLCIAFVIARIVIDNTFGYAFFKKAKIFFVHFLVFRGIPFVLIFIANVLIVYGLFKNNKNVHNLGGNDLERNRIRKEAYITRSMVVITTTYFLCMIPSRVSVGLMYVGIYKNSHNIIFHFQCLLTVINFSCNFILYTLTSVFFRQEYAKLLFVNRCRTQRMSEPKSQTGNCSIHQLERSMDYRHGADINQ